MDNETPKPETMDCPRCKGCGKVPLDPVLQQTLGALREHGDATAAQLHELMAMSGGVTAMCNRLRKLFDLKLIGRRKVGKQWVYMGIPF